jgi:hypothetical protein
MRGQPDIGLGSGRTLEIPAWSPSSILEKEFKPIASAMRADAVPTARPPSA